MAAALQDVEVLRYAAFTDGGGGGNPAGVVLSAEGLARERMQEVAAEVGYSETAFVRARGTERGGRREYDVRYFTPTAEVPFCGHATVATAVALAGRHGPAPLLFHARAGEVPVDVRRDADGADEATLTSVTPWTAEVGDADVEAALLALGWRRAELDRELPPRLAFAGARHLVLAAATRERLARLEYDRDALIAVQRRLDALTVTLLWREAEVILHARNPAPAVGIAEDPATGAAAAAVGHYLASLRAVTPPVRLEIRQGADMGSPSRLRVELEANRPEVRVSGVAAQLAGPERRTG